MAVALIVPEAMSGWAWSQFTGAYLIHIEVNGYIQLRLKQVTASGVVKRPMRWTITHGHFLQMGGFRLHCSQDAKAEYQDILEFHYEVDDGWEGALTYRAFMLLLESGKLEFPSISEEEINDRSKCDIVFKGLAILQLLWFLTQMFVRTRLGLDVTNIEITTSALTISTIFTYACWWSKPLDVHIPVILRLSDTVLHGSNSRINHLDDQRRVNGQNASEGHGSRTENGAVDTSEPSSYTADSDSESDASDLEQEPLADSQAGSAGTNESNLAGSNTAPSQLSDQTSAPEDTSHGLIDNPGVGYTGGVETISDHTSTPLHGITGKGRRITHGIEQILVFPWKAIHLLCLYTVVLPFAFSPRSTFSELLAQKWKHLNTIFYATDFSLKGSTGPLPLLRSLTLAILGSSFIIILTIASTNTFPTSFEQKAWLYAIKVSMSMALARIWFNSALASHVVFVEEHFPGRQSIIQRTRVVASQLRRVFWWFYRLIGFSCVFIYITARFGILILSVISLRKLTETASQTVDWLELVPHI